jgi:hypothetical protein
MSSVTKPQSPDPGLCGHCRHARLVDSGRSVFYLCGRSFTDPAYRKYPPLPVRACPGFEEGPPTEQSEAHRTK